MAKWQLSPLRKWYWMRRRCSISPSIRVPAPRHRGETLLEHVIDEVEKLGVVTLWLEVRASNVAAIALYESVGFNEATIRRNYYPTTDGREDAIIMALPISM